LDHDLTLIPLTHIYIIDGILDLAQAHTPNTYIHYWWHHWRGTDTPNTYIHYWWYHWLDTDTPNTYIHYWWHTWLGTGTYP
jgi:hypothetical protein